MKTKIGDGDNSKGFTLIELIVVMSIMVIINGVIFFDYPSVMANLALKRTAGEIALVARQAQVYALSAKSGVSGELVNYGVHFDKNAPSNTKIILFADNNNNRQYNSSPDEAVQTFEIQTKDKIISLCGDDDCIGKSMSTVDIVYQRLKPTATIMSPPTCSGGILCSSVKITVQSHRNSTTKDVTIYSTGYIK